jgi:hypothetical protein
MNRIKSVPKEKWTDEETLKELISLTAKESGKSYSAEEIDQLIGMFKNMLQDGSQATLISLLLRHGVSKSQIDELREKFQS